MLLSALLSLHWAKKYLYCCMRWLSTILLVFTFAIAAAQDGFRYPDDLYRYDQPQLQPELDKAINLFTYGSTKRAIKVLEKHIASASYHFDAYVLLGYLYYDTKQYEKAVDNFNQALQLHDDDPGLYFIKGNCFLWLQKYAAAYDNYLKCLWIQPDFAGAHNNIAIVRLRFQGIDEPHRNEILKARDDIYQTLQDSIADEKMLFNMGLIQLHLTENAEAVKYFTQTLDVEPNFSKAHFYRGLSYYYQRMYEHARSDFYFARLTGFEPERSQLFLDHLDKILQYISQNN